MHLALKMLLQKPSKPQEEVEGGGEVLLIPI